MKYTLVLYIDETWPARRDCPWVLLDARNKVAEQGCSAPAHWPAAGSCVLVLGAGQCVQHSVRLPRSGRREEPALLRYALEEKLVDDVEQQHFVVAHRHADDEGLKLSVLVVAKARMRQLQTELDALGRAPDKMITELQIPALLHPGDWSLVVGPTDALVLSADGDPAMQLDPASAGAMVSLLLQQARARNDQTPKALRILLTPGSAHAALLSSLDVGIVTERDDAYPWWQVTDLADDLLQGAFAPARRSGGLLSRVRAPLAIGAAAIVVLLVVSLVELFVMRHQLADTEARMQRTFATAVPGVPAIAPSIQLRRELDLRLAAHGHLRHDDFLMLLDVLTETAGGSIRGHIDALEYDEGVLKVSVDTTAIDVALLAAQLRTLGWPAERSAEHPHTLTLDTRRNP